MGWGRGGGDGAISVQEADGSPNVSGVTTIVVGNTDLTDDGSGQVTLATASDASVTNALLDASNHTDTSANAVARGSVITGQGASPTWAALAKGNANEVLAMDGTATDIAWTALSGATPFVAWPASAGITYGANPAAFTTRNGHGVLRFDDSTDEQIVFEGVAPAGLGSGNLTVKIFWAATGVTINDAVFDVQFEEIDPDVLDIDADSFAAAQSVTDTAPATDGFISVASITFTIAQADNLSAGSPFRLLLTRDADNAGVDTLVGDAQVLRVSVEQ